jgi:hypothetical protein
MKEARQLERALCFWTSALLAQVHRTAFPNASAARPVFDNAPQLFRLFGNRIGFPGL